MELAISFSLIINASFLSTLIADSSFKESTIVPRMELGSCKPIKTTKNRLLANL